MTKPRKKKRKPFIVGVAQDLSEYATVQVDAIDSSEAEEIVSDLLEQEKLTELEYTRGDDREGPYTCDSSEKEADQFANCIIKGDRIIFPTRSKLPTPTATGPLTACPQCGAELNASVRITLYTVKLDETGQVTSFEGGPQPESESDLIDLCESDNTTITCVNNHHISGPPIKPTASIS
jgi:hypothetical protein